jgi:adenosine deaminase
MPKADVGLHFEGSLPRDLLDLFSEQNDIPMSMKPSQYRDLMSQLDKPDAKRIYEIAGRVARWIAYPDDLTRSIYEIGLSLHKQNIRYAEIQISPSIYSNTILFETFLNAINDGRDRLWRAWQVRVNWILCIPRDDPRSGDDIARYTAAPLARRGNVLGLGLNSVRINRDTVKRASSTSTRRSTTSITTSTEADDIQPSGQFKRPFTNVQKREIPTLSAAHNHPKQETVREIIENLNPSRLTEVGGTIRDEEGLLELLAEQQTACVTTPSRDLRLNKLASLSDYPYQQYCQRLNISLSASMPTFYRTTLTDEMLLAVEHGNLSIDDIEKLALNAVRQSFLPADEKAALLAYFSATYATLRREHLGE